MVWGGSVTRFLLAALFAAIVTEPTSAVSFKEVPELDKVFFDHGVTGTFVLFDVAADKIFVWNKERRQNVFVCSQHRHAE
jgi:hypothetical protein